MKTIIRIMKTIIRKWLGIEEDIQILMSNKEMFEDLLLHKKSRDNGFAVLKKHLNRPDKPLPRFSGKEIEQD